LDKELSSAERRGSQAGAGSARRGREKTLMEELAELGASVGEELVEFLEMGLAGLEDDTQAAKAKAASSSAAARAAGEAAKAAGQAAGAAAARGAEQSVEEQLRQMKRDMGLE